MTKTRLIAHIVALSALALFTMGAYASCEVETPHVHVGVHSPIHTDVTVTTTVRHGALHVDYSLYGSSCSSTGTSEIAFVLLDGGTVVAEEFGLDCNTLKGLSFSSLSWGSYTLEIRGYDHYGDLAYLFSGRIHHDGVSTDVLVELTPY